LDEVAEIVAIDAGRETAFDEDEVLSDPLDICRICSSLVVVSGGAKWDENPDARDSKHGDEQNIKADAPDEDDNPSLPPSQQQQFLLLAHHSVKEYLVSVRAHQGLAQQFSLQEAFSHNFIARCCLMYLLQFGSAEYLATDKEELERAHKLMKYSASSWDHHIQHGEIDDATIQPIKRLFARRHDAFDNWLRFHHYWGYKLGKNAIPPLCVASRLGLNTVVEYLIDSEGANVNEVHKGAHLGYWDRFSAPLIAASSKGHEETVKLLLQRGADIKLCVARENALSAASRVGHLSIVKLLLDNGAEVNTKARDGGAALVEASRGGHTAVVHFLLERGADIDVCVSYGETALQDASARGYKDMVKILLERGADINVAGN